MTKRTLRMIALSCLLPFVSGCWGWHHERDERYHDRDRHSGDYQYHEDHHDERDERR